jgi:Na+/glutamate symporter
VTVLAIKTVVFAMVAFVVSLVTCLASFWAAQAIYAGRHLDTLSVRPA